MTISRTIGRKFINIGQKYFCVYNENLLKWSIKICTTPGYTLSKILIFLLFAEMDGDDIQSEEEEEEEIKELPIV